MTSDQLKALFKDDDMDLLKITERSKPLSSSDRLESSFLEIVEFFDKNNRTPSPETSDTNERKLGVRLRGILGDEEKVAALKHLDAHDLLVTEAPPESMGDLLQDDDLDLLDDPTGILTIKNIPKTISPPEYIGKQRRCDDFDRFEPLFKACHDDLKSGMRKIVEFKHQSRIVEGNYFVLRGILVYVDKVGEKTVAANGLEDARLRLIYENGTESDILLLSFAKALFLDGSLVTENEDRLLDSFKGIEKEDKESGYIYVLSSKSDDPKIANILNLYKIGFCTTTVEERVKNAAADPTYLMAPVKIVAKYKTYNMNTHKFESLLHRVLSDTKLGVTLVDKNGHNYTPTEWFVVPLDVINQVVSLICSGDILNFSYSPAGQTLTKR